MRLAIISFTKRGGQLNESLGRAFLRHGHETDCFEKRAGAAGEGGPLPVTGSLLEWTGNAFAAYDGLIFVGACGIAVRAVAPFLKDKFTDPAVVAVDEGAGFAVSLLSGHVGGANELCRLTAAFSGAVPVISTATDVNGLFAVDVFAKRNGLFLKDRGLAKKISAKLLAGEKIPFYSTQALADQAPEELAVFERAADFLREPGLKIAVSERKLHKGQGPEPSGELFSENRELLENGGILENGKMQENEEMQGNGEILYLVPKTVTAGMGCRRGMGVEALSEALSRAFSRAGIFQEALSGIATIEKKKDEEGLLLLAESRDVPFFWYKREELLALSGRFSHSDFVRDTVGVDCVCERAAVLGSGGGSLLLEKQAADGVTVAAAGGLQQLTFAKSRPEGKPEHGLKGEGAVNGKVYVIGIGPGAYEKMTIEAAEALKSSDVIVGYTVYVELVKEHFPGKEFLTTPMTKEVERCELAFSEAAKGKTVAMICSGDAGVYGMTGLMCEIGARYPQVELKLIGGVTAATGGAAVLGAPLIHDFAVISLSDLLTPWEKIEKRLELAAAADFVICLYNPSSKKRKDYLKKACDLVLRHQSPDTVCGYVKNIGREGEEGHVLTLSELRDTQVDMFTTVWIGNSQTKRVGGQMVTPRGYAL